MLNDLGLNVIPPNIKSTTFFEKKNCLAFSHTGSTGIQTCPFGILEEKKKSPIGKKTTT